MRNERSISDTDPQPRMSEKILDEMACQELVEVITDYLEGTLAEPDRHRFEAHLAVCSSCREYLEQMRTLIRRTGGLSAQSIRPESRNALLRAFRTWRDSRTDL